MNHQPPESAAKLLPQKKKFWNKPLFQSAPNLSIYQNYSLKKYLFKIAPSRLVPQESYFQACFLKKEIFKILLKIAFSKNTFSKLIPQKYIFKTAHLKNAHFQKYFLKISPSKNTFPKLHLQKIHFDTFNLFFIRVIRRTFYLINNMSNNLLFFFNVFTLSKKHLQIIVFIFFESRIQADYC